MGVRYRKYFKQCKGRRNPGDQYGKVIEKGIDCEGKRGKHCPPGVPKDKPCGGWSIEFRDQHGTWKSIIKPSFTKTLALEAYNEIARNIDRGLFDLPILQEGRKFTVEDYSKKYLEHIKGSVPENTYVNRQTAVKAITKHLGTFEVSKINIVLIQRFCTDVMQKDQAKASTVNQYCSVLRLILDMAVQERIINSNPMQEFKRLKVDETNKRILTNEEIKLILDESALPASWERMAILIGMFTGLRLMDVITLKWSDIDLNNSMLNIIQQKTGRVTTLPLSSYLIGELRKYKDSLDTRDYLFYNGKVNRITEAIFSRHFVKLFKQLGILNFSFHGLRHTNASKVTEIVQDVSIASRMLGHASISTTMGYIHRDMESKKNAVEKFTNHLLGLTEYEPGTKQKIA